MTMREYVAKSMYDKAVQRRRALGLPDRMGWGPSWDALMPGIREIWLSNTDAALDALQYPTEEMIAFANTQEAKHKRDLKSFDVTGFCLLVYQSLIRAAKDGAPQCRHNNTTTWAAGVFCSDCGTQVGQFLCDKSGPGDVPVRIPSCAGDRK